VLRLADYLSDFSSENRYGRPLAYLIERLFAHSCLEEAKYLLDVNRDYVAQHLSQYHVEELAKVEMSEDMEDIKDTFGPVT
jgi:hypothetical protein